MSAKAFDSIDIKQINSLKTKVNYAQSIVRLTHILLSSLHIWSIDQQLDKLFVEWLSLQKPKFPIAFGRITRGAHLFVMFPPKRAIFEFPPQSDLLSKQIQPQKSLNLINFDDDDESGNLTSSAQQQIKETQQNDIVPPETPSPTKEFWLSGKSLTTEHLLAILAISNSFMNLQNFVDLQAKKE
jgi:hypothetical protein